MPVTLILWKAKTTGSPLQSYSKVRLDFVLYSFFSVNNNGWGWERGGRKRRSWGDGSWLICLLLKYEAQSSNPQKPQKCQVGVLAHL